MAAGEILITSDLTDVLSSLLDIPRSQLLLSLHSLVHSFEEGIVQAMPACEVHTFDHTIVAKKVPDGVTFHKWGLAETNNGSLKTLLSITRELGHDQPNVSLELLKIDVEGKEWGVLNPLLEERALPFARQILIELHPGRADKRSQKRGLVIVRRFFTLMHEVGYRIVHKEPNTYNWGTLQEYNFLLFDVQ